MKRFAFIVFSLLTCISYGHQDYYQFGNFGNLTYGYVSEGNSLELDNKRKIAAYLCYEYVKVYCDTSEIPPVFIEFYRPIFDKKPFVTVGYDTINISSPLFENKCYYTKGKKNNAIKIVYNSNDLHTPDLLKLLQFSLDNFDFIKENQAIVSINHEYGDDLKWRLNSIGNEKIIEILNAKPDKRILDILNKKIFRNIAKDNRFSRDYYYCDGYFHFYKNLNNRDTVLLKVQDVYQIVKACNGSLVFDTDSSFYYIDYFFKRASNKYILQGDSNNVGAREFRIFENINCDKKIIFTTGYTKDKVLFIPGKKVVIWNYDHLVEELLNKHLMDKKESKKSYFNEISWSILSFIILILVIKIRRSKTREL